MSGYLMEFSFGPVQNFIAAARRTADLWAGSRMLSDIARRAGEALLKLECTLIYPDADRIRAHNSSSEEPVSNVSNVMLVRVPEGLAPHQVAEQVKNEVERLVVDWGDQVLGQKRIASQLRENVFQAQLNDALEYFVAWAPIGDDYPAAYTQLKKAFAARKNTRDFNAYAMLPEVTAGLPKNSLDGFRETVLNKTVKRGLSTPLMLGEAEQLDALGVLKRALPRLDKGRLDDEARFTPLTRIALDPWLRRLATQNSDALEELKAIYEGIVTGNYGTRVKGNGGAYGIFPFDGALLYSERRQQAVTEARKNGEAEVENALQQLETLTRKLFREQGTPSPYAALMMADGDRMGKFVGCAETPDQHNALTKAIAGFADEAIRMCREWNAHCVYAGGEDVMALIPLDAILGAGPDGHSGGLPRALAKAFDARIEALIQQSHLKVKTEDRTTLRVGVVIAHTVEPLGVIREWAGEAEGYAKGVAGSDAQGNALGLILRVRAGHDRRIRLSFNDPVAFDAMQAWIDGYTRVEGRARALSARVGYDLIAIAEDIQRRHLPTALGVCEVQRLFQRARQGGGQLELSEDMRAALQARIFALEKAGFKDVSAVEQLGMELVVARWLSAVTLNELGREERS